MSNHNFILAPVDTDSISFCKQDMSPFGEDEQESLLKEINSMMPKLIRYAHDGYFETVVCIRAKNYILYDGELHIKGSGLKATMREVGLKDFIDEIINCLVFDKVDQVLNVYNKYINEIHNIKDITRWTSKKTITNSVLNPERSTEQKILDAIKGRKVQMGDKIWVFFRPDGTLGLREDWNNDHCTATLLKKLFNTIEIFDTVLPMTQFTNYALKSHEVKCKLHEVLGLPAPEKVKRGKKNNVELIENNSCN